MHSVREFGWHTWASEIALLMIRRLWNSAILELYLDCAESNDTCRCTQPRMKAKTIMSYYRTR